MSAPRSQVPAGPRRSMRRGESAAQQIDAHFTCTYGTGSIEDVSSRRPAYAPTAEPHPADCVRARRVLGHPIRLWDRCSLHMTLATSEVRRTITVAGAPALAPPRP